MPPLPPLMFGPEGLIGVFVLLIIAVVAVIALWNYFENEDYWWDPISFFIVPPLCIMTALFCLVMAVMMFISIKGWPFYLIPVAISLAIWLAKRLKRWYTGKRDRAVKVTRPQRV